MSVVKNSDICVFLQFLHTDVGYMGSATINVNYCITVCPWDKKNVQCLLEGNDFKEV